MADSTSRPGPGIRTFVMVDIRGYTRWSQEFGDAAAADLTACFTERVRQGLGDRGDLVEVRGDEALAAFASARSAIAAAIAIQRLCRGDGADALPLGVGIGIEAGEGVAVGDGFRGRALNVAARLCATARGGEIVVTETVRRLAGPLERATYSPLRQLRVKGVDDPVSVCSVDPVNPLPALPASPRPAVASGAARRRPSRRVIAGAAVGAVVAAVALIAVLAEEGGSSRTSSVSLAPNSIAEVDAASGQPVGDVPVGYTPGALAGGGGAIWAADPGSNTVERIDPGAMRAASPIGVGIAPTAMAVGFGRLWVYDPNSRRAMIVALSGPTSTSPLRLPACPTADCLGLGGVTPSARSMWFGQAFGAAVAAADYGAVWRVDPDTLKVGQPITHVAADRLAYGEGSVWTYGANGFHGDQIDETSGRRVQAINLGIVAVYTTPGLVVAFRHAWLVSPNGTLYQEVPGPGSHAQQPTVPIPVGSNEIAATPRWLWVTGAGGTLTKVDPYTLRVVTVRYLPYQLGSIVFAQGHLWIAVGPRTS